MSQSYGKAVVEVVVIVVLERVEIYVALVCVVAVMVIVAVALDNVVFVSVKLVLLVLVMDALVAVDVPVAVLVVVEVPVAVIVIVWLVLVMDALVAVDVPVAVIVIDVEFVSVKLVGVLEAVVVDVLQPTSSCLQHQVDFAADHPVAIFLTPAEQLKGNVVKDVVIEVLVRVPDVTVFVALVSVTRVADDVTVRVEVLVTDVAVGWHPTPMAEQQNTFLSCDQRDRCAIPGEQSYSNGVSARRTCDITIPASPALSGEVDVALVAPARRPGSSFCLPAPSGLGVVTLCALTSSFCLPALFGLGVVMLCALTSSFCLPALFGPGVVMLCAPTQDSLA